MATEVVEEKTTQRFPNNGRQTIHTTSVDHAPSDKRVFRKRRSVFKAYQVVWYVLAIIEILLAFRFFLELFGANSYSPFTHFIYTVSYPFVYPFLGVFGITTAGRSEVEWPIFVAALVYAAVAYLLSPFLQILYPVSSKDIDIAA